MRVSTLSSLLAVAALLVGISAASDARAEEEFSVSAAGGTVTVTGNGAWHVNKAYPWKIGSVGKDKIEFAGCHDNACTSAKATGLSGKVTVKIGVCNGDNCKSFTKEVSL